MIICFAVCFLVSSIGVNLMAENSVIDFEDHLGCSSKVVGGYLQIMNSRGTICSGTGSSSNSVSSGSRFSNDVMDLVVTQVDNQAFTPISMRVAEYSISYVDPPSPLTVKGFKADGSEVDLNIFFDGLRDGPGGVDDFQTVLFPSSFADVIRVEFGPGSWSLDDLIADAPATPPVTIGPVPQGQFNSATKILDLPLNILGPARTPLVFLDDYTYREDDSADSILDARDQNLKTVIGVETRVIDPIRFDFYQMLGETSTILRYMPDGTSELVVSLAQMQDLGYDVELLHASAAHDGKLLFKGLNFSESDSYFLFILDVESRSISMLVGPSTELPSETAPAFPHYFPNNETIGEGGVAFDTSTSTSRFDRVVFERPTGSSSIRRIISEGDDTGFGKMQRVREIFYQGSNLVIDVDAVMGKVRLVYLSGVRVSSSLASFEQPITGEAITYDGDAVSTDKGARFVNSGGVVYQTYEGSLYRIVGPNSMIDGTEISSAEYLATSSSNPEKILIKILAEDSSKVGLYEIAISQPPTGPSMEIGGIFIWPEPHLFYIPIDYATVGKNYTLYKSYDLVHWEVESIISSFDVRPRFSYPIKDDENVFFKVRETNQP